MAFAVTLDRARALDNDALAMLYRRFLPMVYRFVLSRVGNVAHAEDVTSETFFAMMEGIARTRAHDELSFAAWLLGIARNKAARHFRHLRTHPEAPPLPEDEPAGALLTASDEADPLNLVTAREDWAEVVAALNRLTSEQRDVVLYRCVLGYPTYEVSRLLDKPATAIRQLQHRALTALARHLGIQRPTATGRATVTHDDGRQNHAS